MRHRSFDGLGREACRDTLKPLLHRKREVPFRELELIGTDGRKTLVKIVTVQILDQQNQDFLAPFHPWLKPIAKKHTGFGSRSEAVTILALSFGTNPIVNSATKRNEVARELHSKAFEPRSIFIPVNMTDIEGSACMLESVRPVHMRDASLQKIGPRTFGDGPNLSFGYSV